MVLRNGACPKTGNCDFENGACAWQNNDGSAGQIINFPQADLNWIVQDGHFSAPASGPAYDHTYLSSGGK